MFAAKRATEVLGRRTHCMIRHPRLTHTDADEWAIALSLEPTTEYNFDKPRRETLTLSTRAIGMIVDDLEYKAREEIAPVTARALVLTESAYLPGEKTDPVDLTQRIRLPDGGKHPTDGEIERVAKYIRDAEIEQDARWIVEELIEESRLSDVMEPDEIRTQRERVNGLRGIAKDL